MKKVKLILTIAMLLTTELTLGQLLIGPVLSKHVDDDYPQTITFHGNYMTCHGATLIMDTFSSSEKATLHSFDKIEFKKRNWIWEGFLYSNDGEVIGRSYKPTSGDDDRVHISLNKKRLVYLENPKSNISFTWVYDSNVSSNSNYNNGNIGSYPGGNIGGNNNPTPAPKQQRRCPSCNGTGKGPDQITWGTNYTTTSVWCSICNRSGDPHSHRQPTCRVCYGRGYIR